MRIEGGDFWLQFLMRTMESVVVNCDIGHVVGIVCVVGSMFLASIDGADVFC